MPEHNIYKSGTRWRVIKPGAKLSGIQPIGAYAHQGWGKALEVGEIITCDGMRMTRGDGVPALKWTDQDGNYLAGDCTFRPVQGGMWGGQVPQDGYLELVTDEG